MGKAGLDAHTLKIKAAETALSHVKDGMRLGIGTGSTADEFIRLLAVRVAAGLSIIGVPTSERSAALCRELSVPLASLEKVPELDLTIDGADEIDGDFTLVKGGGGALLREKIVAAASGQMIVIADSTKLVNTLGKFALPVEVNKFGLTATRIAIDKAATKLGLSGQIILREANGTPFETDGGHYIVDASFGLIHDAEALSLALHAIPGVVEHGLFLNMATMAVIAGADGIRTLTR
jgi:ribose 5-phosphate isomerase A